MSGWHLLTQEDHDAFALLTGEQRFAYLGLERARQTPFGGTIARGDYTRVLGRTSRRRALRRGS